MNSGEAVNRAYRSPLRQAQANATRRQIVDAAARLFIEHGYGATSIDAIAEAAGVGRATVFTAVGGKAVLLRAAYDIAIVGDDEPVPLPDRPWAQPVRRATNQVERIHRYADLITLVCGRVAAIYEAFRGGAATDPDVRAQWDDIRAERRQGAANFITMLTEHGPLRTGLDKTAAADVVWILNDPGLYHQLVLQRGWEPERFCEWVDQTMRSQLLAPGRARSRARKKTKARPRAR
jgi:AcrR family transcriptional regulator